MIKKIYSNELLSTILECGFNANEFVGSPISGIEYFGFEIRLKSSSLVFKVKTFGKDADSFQLEFSKFEPGFRLVPFPDYLKSIKFDEVKEKFKWWLQNHIRPFIEERDYSDYWTILKDNPLGIAGIDFTKSEPFKEEERKLLKVALEEIKGLLKENFDLNEQQYLVTEKKIHYLKEALERLNKTDWKGILFTTIVTISYDLAFNAEKRDKLFGLFSKVWSILQALPPHIKAPY